MKKKTWIIAIISFFVVAGGASAFFLVSKTPKEQYFYSEVKTLQHIQDLVETRYENETEWANITKTKATDSTYELLGELEGGTNPEIEEMLNNSKIALRVAIDPDKRELETEVNATILGIEVDPIKGYVTSEEVIVELPFYKQLLQLKDKDFGQLMTTMDPSYTGSETLGLDNLFGYNRFLSEENMEYLKEEYAMYIYDSIPEDAFKAADETVEVNGKSVKAEKVAMTLTEAEIQKILKDVLQKAKKDPKFEEIFKESTESFINQLNFASETVEPFDFDEVMDDMIKSTDDINLPNGIKSTIWHDGDLIVKREFKAEGPETSTFEITGTQSLGELTQFWEYTLVADDETISFNGDTSTTKDGTSKDEISVLSDSDMGLIYNGEEKLSGDERTFERKVVLKDVNDPAEVLWKGKSNYKKDSMQADHEFIVEIDELTNVVVKVNEESKIIKKVNLPTDSEKIVNIGTMDANELEKLLTEDIYPEMQDWGMNIMQQFEQEMY